MGNAPKRPSLREDLKRWDGEGGAPRTGHPSKGRLSSSQGKAAPALYYFNIVTESGTIEDPEGTTCADLQTARKQALSDARKMIAEGDRNGEDRRSWRFEIMDRGNQPVLTVTFSEAL